MADKSPDQVFCQIRKEWVAALPEEVVRQNLVYRMLHELGYPAAHIAVEKSLRRISSLSLPPARLPLRRADIICFGNGGADPGHPFYPLLLVECKAVPLTERMVRQVTGYNLYLQAAYICIANQYEIRTGRFDPRKGGYSFISWLPSHADLCRVTQK